MGCDIHAHTEIKIKGEWHHYSQPRIGRNYDLFARMAGVRNDGSITPISLPRGMPDDATFTTKFVCQDDGSGGHSHSWLSRSELAKLVEWVDDRRHKDGSWYSWEWHELGYLFGNGWADSSGYPKDLEDARIIFWFDN